jgi:serine/threonine protein kinase
MDLALGGDLNYQLKLNKRLTESHTKFIIASITIALRHIHSQGSECSFLLEILTHFRNHCHFFHLFCFVLFCFVLVSFLFAGNVCFAVAHRDLKPANMLMREDGNILLSDFGLCTSDLKPHRVCGTHGYIPPEAYNPGNTASSVSFDWFAVSKDVFLFFFVL